MLDYSHFISLPLAIHPDLVDKLNYFQSSILGSSASNEESDKDESRSEGSIDEMDHDHKQGVGTLQQGYPLLLQQSRTRVVIRSCAGETE